MSLNRTPRKIQLWLTLIPVLVLFLSLFSPVAPSAHATPENGCNDPRVYLPNYNPAPNSHVLVDNWEDVILYGERYDMPYNQIRIVLQSDQSITWWKGVELSYPNWGIVASSFTHENNHYARSIIIDLNYYNPSLLSIKLLKAKLFGIHTGMYCIDNLSAKRGKTLYFYWAWDDTSPRGTSQIVQQ